MSFLSRALVVIGLSFVMTILLMVIHWEPERSVAPSVATPSPTIAARLEPSIQQAADVRTAPTESFRDHEGPDWVMQDSREVEGLPAEVRAALAGCVIPRSPAFQNVVSGEFKQAGQTDLAVLCVRGSQAAVYVFFGGGHPAGPEIATEVDFIPGTFIRTARAVDIEVQVRGELPIEPGMPLRIRHDGIQLGDGCCATTYYSHRGRWRSYVSSD